MQRRTESLREFIRRTLLEVGNRPPVERFLRFGDPRVVKGGVSVIHDPYAYAYAEEPALYGHDPEETRAAAGHRRDRGRMAGGLG